MLLSDTSWLDYLSRGMMKRITIVSLLGLAVSGSLIADDNVALNQQRVTRAIERAYNDVNPSRIFATDPKDEKMVALTRASSAWVTVHERCKTSDDELLRVSYAITILIGDWEEAEKSPDSWRGRKAGEIFTDLQLLTRHAEALRAKPTEKPKTPNKTQQDKPR